MAPEPPNPEDLPETCRDILMEFSEHVLHQYQWVNVPPMPGALVINIGDLLQLVSNDIFKSSEHRILFCLTDKQQCLTAAIDTAAPVPFLPDRRTEARLWYEEEITVPCIFCFGIVQPLVVVHVQSWNKCSHPCLISLKLCPVRCCQYSLSTFIQDQTVGLIEVAASPISKSALLKITAFRPHSPYRTQNSIGGHSPNPCNEPFVSQCCPSC
ncbi:hypothetical protein FRX31_018129 [Thalictrum thalictroides]|uniref:Isopenicillin N synthase-like Fe(2+) 2OG dioxygenase domain-containing protein n=1 Tax=Thalictrum thalictroides TaxID=46969 RepID=A0A7J6W4H5_THATH|nr:hypothetical protein FRX31_018129 [Thalictrum thalictroides]